MSLDKLVNRGAGRGTGSGDCQGHVLEEYCFWVLNIDHFPTFYTIRLSCYQYEVNLMLEYKNSFFRLIRALFGVIMVEHSIYINDDV